MTRRGTALLLAMLASCSPSSAGDPRPGDVALLAGPWEFVVHREGHPDLLGRLTLAPSAPDDPSIPRSLKGGTLEGFFHLRGSAWLTAEPVDSGTSAFIDADSSVIVYLRLQGRCANCGNVGFAGRLTGDRIAGHWVQEFSSHPPEGNFTMQRIGPDSAR